jgi:serine/threonine-protein kinase SRPK3
MSASNTREQTDNDASDSPEIEYEGPFTYGYPPMPFDDLEDIDQYRPGGLHPIVLGDILGDGRYEVVNKLGSGGYATVWLCKDLAEHKWVAVKVLGADASVAAAQCQVGEMAILKHFRDLEVDDDELAANHVCRADDYFIERGPNGKHFCFVLPVLGGSIRDIATHHADQPDTLKDICAQMVKAMKYLHSKGVCHGDFRSANILLKVNIDGATDDEISEMFPWVYEVPVPPIPATGEEPGPHLPKFLYTSTKYQPLPGRPLPTDIVVSDFGEAYFPTNRPEFLGIPVKYAAPEVIVGRDYAFGYATDIWSLGIAICEVRVGTAPFIDDAGPESAVRAFEQVLGPLPEPYRSVWIERGWSGGDLDLPPAAEIPLDEPVSTTSLAIEERTERALRDSGCTHLLEMCIKGKQMRGMSLAAGEDATNLKPGWTMDGMGMKWTEWRVPDEEAGQLFDLLFGIFKYAPDERLTTDEIITHPWFEGHFSAADLGGHITMDAVVEQVVHQIVDKVVEEVDNVVEVDLVAEEKQEDGHGSDTEAEPTADPAENDVEDHDEVFYDAQDVPAGVVLVDLIAGLFALFRALFFPSAWRLAAACFGA